MADKRSWDHAAMYRAGLTDVPPEVDPKSLAAQAKAGKLGSALAEKFRALPSFNQLVSKTVPEYDPEGPVVNQILDVASVPARLLVGAGEAGFNALRDFTSPEHRQMVAEHALLGDPWPGFKDAMGVTSAGIGTAAGIGRNTAMAGDTGGDVVGMAINGRPSFNPPVNLNTLPVQPSARIAALQSIAKAKLDAPTDLVKAAEQELYDYVNSSEILDRRQIQKLLDIAENHASEYELAGGKFSQEYLQNSDAYAQLLNELHQGEAFLERVTPIFADQWAEQALPQIMYGRPVLGAVDQVP